VRQQGALRIHRIGGLGKSTALRGRTTIPRYPRSASMFAGGSGE
jgi:hypothetical protein